MNPMIVSADVFYLKGIYSTKTRCNHSTHEFRTTHYLDDETIFIPERLEIDFVDHAYMTVEISDGFVLSVVADDNIDI